MKLVIGLILGSVALAGQTLASPLESKPYHCKFVSIEPVDADFFTAGSRAFPTVGTEVDIDFEAERITSMTFSNGDRFFSEGEGVLSRVGRVSYDFGGVRIGNNGLYIVLLSEPYSGDEAGTFFVSKLSVTHARPDETGHIVTTATHSGNLECRP